MLKIGTRYRVRYRGGAPEKVGPRTYEGVGVYHGLQTTNLGVRPTFWFGPEEHNEFSPGCEHIISATFTTDVAAEPRRLT